MKQLSIYSLFYRTRYFKSVVRKCLFVLALICLAHLNAFAQYCTPIFGGMGCSSGVLINTFTLNGDAGTFINDIASGCASGNYADSSAVSSVTMSQGGTYTAFISTFSSPACVQIWIDFNNNFSFESSEMVGGQNGVAFDPATSSVTISIPATAATGTHRMRAVLGSGTSFPSLPACPTPPSMSMGEVHDYSVVIAAASAACPAVAGLTVSGVTSSGATISWSAATGSVGYKYVVSTSSSIPVVAGTYTNTTSISAVGLAASTVYYAFIRDTCGPANVSSWVSISFTTAATTTSCPTVTGLTASGVTNTSATISWTAATGSSGYKYVINNMAAAPTGFGIYTSGTSVSPTSLTPSTVYYAHVRDTCGVGSVSSWVTISFTTTATAPSCPPVSGLAATGITSTGATISWTAAAGVAGYKYVINTSPASPTVAGNFTTLNSTPVSALSPGTIYYAHVRDTCGVGNVSSWVTVSFTTLGTASINDLIGANGSLLSVIPNPVSGIATITFSGTIHGSAHLQLIDLTGRMVKQFPLIGTSTEFDMSYLPSGIYICKYADAETATSIRISKQ
jgi:hypothetical protein